MEGDGALTRAELYDGLFQSTPSAWRVTSLEQRLPRNSSISIHTLRMEGDLSASAFFDLSVISIHTLRMEGDGLSVRPLRPLWYFNPHPPHGG